MNRGLKQFTYGAGFLLFFSAVIYGVYALTLKPTPTCFDNRQNGTETGIDCGGGCTPCAQKYAQDIEVDSIIKFASGDARTVVIAYLKNPNDAYGFRDVLYTITAKDVSGQTIGSTSDHLFMYDRSAKIGRYVVAVLDVPMADINDLAMTFSDKVVVARDAFIEPRVSITRSSTDVTGLKTVTGPAYVFGRDLGMKETGDDVKQLEEFLLQKQFFMKLPDGTFDLDTKLALTAYQKSRKIAPANGIFDARTRAKVNAEVDRVTKTVIGSDASVTVGGAIKNNDIVNASKVMITALLYDATGVQLGGSKTELDDMQAGEERSFKILFPKTVAFDQIDPLRTRLFVDAIR